MLMFFKDYLTVDEATSYLHEKTNRGMDIDDLIDLEREGKIKPLLYLQNIAFNEDLNTNDTLISGYFAANGFILLDRITYNPYREYPDTYISVEPWDSFKLEHIVQANPLDSLELNTTGNLYDAGARKGNSILPSVREILPSAIRIKRNELSELFSNGLREYEQKYIDELENQVAELTEKLNGQAEKQVNASIDEGQGDTLLILGAVMECIKEVAKPNYTQQSLINAITDKYKNTSSLTESTLTKKFPKAKTYLKQNVTT